MKHRQRQRELCPPQAGDVRPRRGRAIPQRPTTGTRLIILGLIAWAAVHSAAWASGSTDVPTLKITSPANNSVEVGRIPIQVDVHLPPGSTLAEVALYIDGKVFASKRYGPYEFEWENDGHRHEIKAKARLGGGKELSAVVYTAELGFVERVEVRVVNVFAAVTDNKNNYVTDLRAEDFSIKDDGVVKKVSYFSLERKSLDVMLVMDVSKSMERERRMESAVAAAQLLIEELGDGDRAAVVTFSDEPVAITPFSSDREQLKRVLSGLTPSRGTALYDAIFTGANLFETNDRRRVMVVLSDGRDESFDGLHPGSEHTLTEALENAVGLDVMAFVVGVGREMNDLDFTGKAKVSDHLQRLAEVTGGSFQRADDGAKVAKAFANIADDLRHQYSMGFLPTGPRDKSKHDLEVRVTRPGLVVRARRSYVAN